MKNDLFQARLLGVIWFQESRRIFISLRLIARSGECAQLYHQAYVGEVQLLLVTFAYNASSLSAQCYGRESKCGVKSSKSCWGLTRLRGIPETIESFFRGVAGDPIEESALHEWENNQCFLEQHKQ